MAYAGDMCPAPPRHTQAPVSLSPDDHLIHVDSDEAMVDADGHAVLNGQVKVTQDARTMSADSMNYDYKTGKMAVKGAVDFEDPKLRIKSDTGTYDTVGGAEFDRANFQILDRNGRGYARELAVQPDGKVQLEQVRYTTCPVGNEDWMLQASSIDLDTARQEGEAHGVHMRFKNVPIFYTPYISFPLGDERKSGLLFPSFGHSTSNGYQLEVPYYFNLAPNYDLTLTPGILSARGIQMGAEFRYLTASSHGTVEGNFLPDDRQKHFDRGYFHVTDVTDLTRGLRFDADIATVSDINYFSDFAVGSEATSVTYLERRTEVLYYDDIWRIRGQLQNFQTIDFNVPDYARPYSRVPRVQVEGLYPVPNSPLEFALDGEATNFMRNVGPTGVRVSVQPELRWSSRGPGYFFEPAAGYYFTQYDLQNADMINPTVSMREPSTPTRAMPYGRIDTGLVFERSAGSSGQRSQTLEPRMVYSYVPYRNQDELPIFDTGLPDLNLTELFRTNRYVGGDRIGDANQLAVGLTTRLFDQGSGAQYLSATVGQIRYFSVPRVTLPQWYLQTLAGQPLAVLQPQNPLGIPGQIVPGLPQQYSLGLPGQFTTVASRKAQAILQGQIAETFPASDVVTEISLTAYKHFNINLDYQVNPYTWKTDKSEILVQYHPDPNKVVNLGYRFQDGILKQYDGSFAWPIAGHWNTVGRWVYSLQDHQTIEQLAGFEYKSCCYRIQVVQRRYLSNRTATGNGGLDTSFALQLELTGLSSVGKPADMFLQKEIQGYIAHDPDAPDAAKIP
ncbi:MAG: LPS-assembly protein [Gammaproteobacteria bacterium]|nr:LPS-assembly protein [Gammaproteobacteria bacterium]